MRSSLGQPIGHTYPVTGSAHWPHMRQPNRSCFVCRSAPVNSACVTFTVDSISQTGDEPVPDNFEVAELAAEHADVLIPFASTAGV